MLQFILTSICVFLAVIVFLVVILLIAKRYLSPSGNVNIEINGEKTISVPQGASLMSTLTDNGIFYRRHVEENQVVDNARCKYLKAEVRS